MVTKVVNTSLDAWRESENQVSMLNRSPTRTGHQTVNKTWPTANKRNHRLWTGTEGKQTNNVLLQIIFCMNLLGTCFGVFQIHIIIKPCKTIWLPTTLTWLRHFKTDQDRCSSIPINLKTQHFSITKANRIECLKTRQ